MSFDDDSFVDFTDVDDYYGYHLSSLEEHSSDDPENLRELWQEEERSHNKEEKYNTPLIREQLLTFGRSINIIDFLKSRDTGEQCARTKKTRTATTLLSFCLMSRWPVVSKLEMLLDAKLLLERRLNYWEGTVLCQNYTKDTLSDYSVSRKDALMHLVEDTNFVVPVTLIDIIATLTKTVVNRNTEDGKHGDFMLSVCKENKIREDCADFFELLITRGYSFKRKGEEMIRALCNSRYETLHSNAKFRILEMLFNYGLKLSAEATRDLIPEFVVNILEGADETAGKILNLLLAHGCLANEALQKMGNVILSPYKQTPDFWVKNIFTMIDVLLENGAQINDIPAPGGSLGYCFLFKTLECASCDPSHPSMLNLLKRCIARGLNVKTTGDDRQSLMMSFCKIYKNDDLVDVVRLLVSSGVDVNALDGHGHNALFHLAHNRPNNRQSIYDVVCLLIELEIDAKQKDSSGSTTLTKFLSEYLQPQCCEFRCLINLNESRYWEILDLLWEAGSEGHQTTSSSRYNLNLILERLREVQSNRMNFCENCLESSSDSSLKDVDLTALGTVHFAKAHKFIERLVRTAHLSQTVTNSQLRNPLIVACRYLAGERLVALVKLFCENGINVNVKFQCNDWPRKEGSTMLNAIGVLLQYNERQAYLTDLLIEIMEPYGFEEYENKLFQKFRYCT